MPTHTAPRYPVFLGISVYSFEGIGLALPLEAAMRDRTMYRPLLHVTYVLVTLIFLCFGVLTYVGFG